ncbi:MAG: GNAT family N-acetyltransferase [Betaproteobacteria bacterium]|nr:GNAT family N-acetyltransferase [Betaproteobacteria bacterium]
MTQLTIIPATQTDIPAAVAACVDAFHADPLMTWFFGDHASGRDEGVKRFFTLLMAARIALGAPVLVAKQEGSVIGLAMGYRTDRPAWPKEIDAAWAEFEAGAPQIVPRFGQYEAVSDARPPVGPHWYLGVIGVRNDRRGTGVGKALLKAFCALSDADPQSTGVYLETANPASLRFYERNGFVIREHDVMEGVGLWCVFRPSPV